MLRGRKLQVYFPLIVLVISLFITMKRILKDKKALVEWNEMMGMSGTLLASCALSVGTAFLHALE